MGVYDNPNLLFIRDTQYVTFAGTSDQSAALDPNTEAVSLYADTVACWVKVGTNPTAAAPGAEKTKVDSLFIPAGVWVDVAVPRGTDSAPQLVAVIQATTGGNLYIAERKST